MVNLDALLDGDPQIATPEFALVVTATRWPHDPHGAARIRALAARVTDWPRFAMIVERHRVAGLVAAGLNDAGLNDTVAGADVRAAIRAMARDSAVQELQSVFETLHLVRALEGAGIPVRVLKGATAAMLAFGRYGVRYSMDIDLIVAKDQIAQAASLLDARGYVRSAPAADASAATMRARMARYKDLAFQHPDSGLMVELHWRLFQNPYLLRGDDLDARAPMQLVPGASVTVLPRAPAILYLFAHGTEHGWARLKWLADIGAILTAQTPAEVDRFYTDAQQRGVARLVAAGLILSHALYETPLPGAIRDDLTRDWRLRSLVRTAHASLVGDEDGRELEQVSHATTRKNLSHYLISRDPRFVIHELRYDLLDHSAEGLEGVSRFGRLSQQLWALTGGRRHAGVS